MLTDSYFFYFLVLLGIAYTIRPAMSAYNFLYRSAVRGKLQSKNHTYEAYGAPGGGTWAVVTGGSDGIGLALCQNLAEQGFNICIVSRNEQKINKALAVMAEEVKGTNSAFKTRCVVADFSQIYTIQDYKEKVADKVADLDIGLLIINAGVLFPGDLTTITDKECEDAIRCLNLQYFYCAKVMLDQLIKRNETKKLKSGLVFVNSYWSTQVGEANIPYAASKNATASLAQGLYYELKEKNIEVLDYQPGYVSTNLVSGMGSMSFVITPDHSARVCLRDLGHDMISAGAFVHGIVHFASGYILPQFMLDEIQVKPYRDGKKKSN